MFKKKAQVHGENPYQRARKAAGMTQEEAAEHLPFSLRSIQAYESGEVSPKYESVVAMAELYGCGVDAFAPPKAEGGEKDDSIPSD